MTAEIAILNKTAVALAADSAVTISAGNHEEKIFDSADKLFELSTKNAIGIMIYNGTNLTEIPLPSLIRDFRSNCSTVESVNDAADQFLTYLHTVGSDAPPDVKDAEIQRAVYSIVDAIVDRFNEKFQENVLASTPPLNFRSIAEKTLLEVISTFEYIHSKRKTAAFVGGKLVINKKTADVLRSVVDDKIPVDSKKAKDRLVSLLKRLLRSSYFSPNLAGIVISGFGKGDLFPTLVAYEVDGIFCNRLKYRRTHHIDIDRAGPRARVLPFAQKEMVHRFLYGLDSDIQRHIRLFCTRNIGQIRKSIVDKLDFENEDDKKQLMSDIHEAEEEFLDGLNKKAFGQIRSVSRAEIEDMVEFMPKPELAKMAEALVDLTSIKRRVSRGMETVGGPIDVAVISASEGFIWVNRKHYFDARLNARYVERMHAQAVS